MGGSGLERTANVFNVYGDVVPKPPRYEMAYRTKLLYYR